ncbi:hypothetical protein CI109_101839 [Kwoniella shandongensis]|uniref:Uncharacterized protein n=1 Tax=Kwoniella shandongensis TaxID=1734106 RepID=A0A5M6BUE8_9TREE|nr:uncharacterized protein CI109_007015 [Kwoniella shandongensis]KAA5524629.1 hypothetical protein CI109_007015 [Kwoniella shandongensis]
MSNDYWYQMSHPYPHAEGSQHHRQQQHQHHQQRFQQDRAPLPPPAHLQSSHNELVPPPLDQQYQYYPPPPPLPPSNIYYDSETPTPGPSVRALNKPPAGYEPNLPQIKDEPISITLPQHMPLSYMQQQQQGIRSPFETPTGMPMNSMGSSHSGIMNEYFPSFDGKTTIHPSTTQLDPLQSGIPLVNNPNWESTVPPPISNNKTNVTFSRGKSNTAGPSGIGAGGSKTSRQQFTACGACRHRRVKCDLKDKQEQAEKLAEEGGEDNGVGPIRKGSGGGKAKRVSCTNCIERGLNCIDEFAPLKAAKQLRRGKRISEIEMLFGKSAASAAVVHRTVEQSSDSSMSPVKGKEVEVVLPELTRDFFESAFFRRFQIQRPILDPAHFVGRYLSNPVPCAAAMGPEGAILCHVLYAWAVSYGVDENGLLDVPEGGGAPLDEVNLLGPSESEIVRERDRQRRKDKMRKVIEVVLKEIDDCGVLRKPTWDGVRVLLTVLPLTEGISTPVERLTMYESAISQVFQLCSFGGLDYDGAPSGTASVNGGQDDPQDLVTVRVRVYWYAFVHEGITTGLKGGRLHLDEDDLETMQDSIDNRALVRESIAFQTSSKFATAPINLALACRKINKALTGPAARRRTTVNPELVKQAWEALEKCWETFEDLKFTSQVGPYTKSDELMRFSDGWKIFLFEAQNVIRTNLEDRLSKLSVATTSAHITDSTASSPESVHGDLVTVQHLLDIAKSKCDVMTKQILEIVKRHVGTRFFEWDASLVRDGTYYAAMLLAREGGSDEDIVICIKALNELRWAHSRSWDRSADLRREWQERSSTIPVPQSQTQSWESVLSDLARLSNHDQSSQSGQGFSASDEQSVSTGEGSVSRVHHQHQHHHQHRGQHYHHPQHPHHHKHPQQDTKPRHPVYRGGDTTTASSSSPFTSPQIISPTFDPNATVPMTMMGRYGQQQRAQSAPEIQMYPSSSSAFTQSQLEMVGEVDGEMDGDDSYKWVEPPIQHHHHPQHHHQHNQPQQHYLQSQGQGQPIGIQMEIPSSTNPAYQIYQRNDLGPPPLNSLDLGVGMNMNVNMGMGVGVGVGVAGPQGQYVIQQDGSHVFVPFRAE